jgi:hypothetical protein
MVILIAMLVITIGILTSAFMAGGTEKHKNTLLWSSVGLVLSATVFFFCKRASLVLLLKIKPHLLVIAESMTLPYNIILQLAVILFCCGIIFLVLYSI